MIIDIPQHLMLRLAAMTVDDQRAWMKRCHSRDVAVIDAAFEAWSESGQLQPDTEGWRVWLMMAGRGYGKTRAGSEWIHQLAMIGKKRIALVGATIDEARSIMVEGVSGLLSVAPRQRVKIKWEPSLGRLTWPRGSVAELFSGESPEGLRGPEHDFAWCAHASRPSGQRFGRRRTDCRAADYPGPRRDLSRGGGGERVVRRARRILGGIQCRRMALCRSG